MHRTAFSIASILLLMAVLAVYLGAMGSVQWRPGEVRSQLMIGCAIGGLVIGMVIGAGIGLKQTGQFFGTLGGFLSGGIAGAAGGALVAAPTRLPAILVGSAVLILFAIAVRHFSDPSSPGD